MSLNEEFRGTGKGKVGRVTNPIFYKFESGVKKRKEGTGGICFPFASDKPNPSNVG